MYPCVAASFWLASFMAYEVQLAGSILLTVSLDLASPALLGSQQRLDAAKLLSRFSRVRLCATP